MGRRPDTGDTDVSLFPFLSILACIIGVLTLMIATLALLQMDNDVVVRAEEYESITSDLAQQQASLAELEKQFVDEQQQMASQASAQQKELVDKRGKIKQLKNQFLLARKKRDELDKPAEQREVPEQQPLSELEEALGGLKEQVAQLTVELEEKKRPPQEAEVTVVPGGSGRGIKPRFVECTKNGIVLHNTDELVQIRPANIEKSEPFLKLLDSIAGDENAKLIFLIRKDGVHVWWRAKRFADSLEVANGKLPVLGQGKLNLERVRKK